ncbi:MAG TPA: endonuclease [Pedobacter sp.]|uniref:endonuclease n=1 Tax=Pedobacter sp. TaxID=1411316 RepID=UPI002C1F1559|nr:endonuclease [Pedobacter sp.]HMI04634.1 endonuclease [Pedobacter sp.]
MKAFEKFLEQISLTEARQTSGTAPDLPEFADLTNRTGKMEFTEFADNPFVAKQQRGILAEKINFRRFTEQPENKVVSPKQFGSYIQQNDISLKQIINDKRQLERIIDGDDMLEVNYLIKGALAAKSVCRVTVISESGDDDSAGTGFLIAPNIMITNNHVLSNKGTAGLSYAEFNYELGADNLPTVSRVFRFNPEKLFYTNQPYDYTIIWLEETSADGAAKINEFGFLKLNPSLGKTKEGNFVSVIQHPDGKKKKVAIRGNRVTSLDLPVFIRYETDTKNGASGAPVFNDKWEVVALHHSGVPNRDNQLRILNLKGEVWEEAQGESQINWLENEGVRVSSIIIDITTKAAIEFPFLLNHFSPVTDPNILIKSVGKTSEQLEKEVYYPQEKDEENAKQYYREIPDISASSFDQLHNLLKKTHTKHHNYSPSEFVYPKVDLYHDGKLRSIYSTMEFSPEELILADKKVDIDRELKFIEISKHEKMVSKEAFTESVIALEALLPYNCEHVVCQSWFRKQEPMKGDLHHLFACESGCNSFRNDHAYTEFEHYKPVPADQEKERLKCGNMENDKFEPENNKGVVARAVLYFLVRYPKTITKYESEDITMLKNWSSEQKITLYEKHRNHEIFQLQGNRNPFIDFPGLEQKFDFSNAI